MAKNRVPEQTVEYETESGEEENDEDASEEVGSSESESDPEPEPAKPESTKKVSSVPMAAMKKPNQAKQPPPSSDDEETESESDSDTGAPDLSVKPVASKPSEDANSASAARRPRSKPGASGTVTPVKSAGIKRHAEDKKSEADAKRSKTTEDPKKQLFQRLWSEDDEIVILKGMIDYVEQNKADPVADLNAFHDFIKANLHVDVTRTQLQDKIRRLKRKYENNKSKVKEGKDRAFSKPHEQKTYDLSKHVWGNESDKVESTPKANGTTSRKSKRAIAVENGTSARKDQKKITNPVETGEQEISKNVEVADVEVVSLPKIANPDYLMEEKVLRIGSELFEGDKKLEGSEEWKKLKIEEMEIFLKKVELVGAQTRLVLDVLKSKV